MEKPMTLSQLFECGIAAENAARDFYLGLIQKFSSQPAISAFWKTMSDDEESHARTLEKARNSLPGDKLAGFVDAVMAEKARTLRKLSVPELLDSIHNLNDAYLQAHELESSDINTVFNFLKLKLVPDSEKGQLSTASIERHLQKLIDFPKTFGDAPMRKSIDVDA